MQIPDLPSHLDSGFPSMSFGQEQTKSLPDTSQFAFTPHGSEKHGSTNCQSNGQFGTAI